jgi:3'-5' exoribonuclease
MWQELESVVGSIGNEHIRGLLERILSDPEIAARYKLAPAAKSLHHAYLGGLLEHVLSLCRLARLVLQNYPSLDPDLVLAGAVLHDLGKIHELSYSRSFGYTSEGQLLGHMIIELEIVHKTLAGMPDFPRPLQTLLEHIIISHHGQYEFGSPKLPMFREALLFHYLDDLDSKLQNIDTILKRDAVMGGEWTRYSPSLGRTILDTQKFLGRAETPPAEAEAASGDEESGGTAE